MAFFVNKYLHFTITVPKATFSLPVTVKEEADKITIEGRYVDSPRIPLLVKKEHECDGVCPLCALNLNLKHTVRILFFLNIHMLYRVNCYITASYKMV